MKEIRASRRRSRERGIPPLLGSHVSSATLHMYRTSLWFFPHVALHTDCGNPITSLILFLFLNLIFSFWHTCLGEHALRGVAVAGVDLVGERALLGAVSSYTHNCSIK